MNIKLRSLFSGLAVTQILLAALAAHSHAGGGNVKTGEALFKHEWNHVSLPQLDRQWLSDAEYESELMKFPGDGLGPMFNATSCEACHVGGGASDVKHNVTLITIDPRSPVLKASGEDELKVAKEAILDLYPGFIAPGGTLSVDVVVHEYSSRPLFDLVRRRIANFVPGGISHQWYQSKTRTSDAIADQPVIAGRKGNIDFYLSQRNSPPLFGLGVIDRIEAPTMVRVARSQAQKTNGVVTGRMGTGKFGWRGQTVSLDAFVRGACAGEVGLQLRGTPQPPDMADPDYISLGTDLTEPQVQHLVSYVRSLPHPRQNISRVEKADQIQQGKMWFKKIGCSTCHVEDMFPARGIFSDLLLHDMGSLLQAPAPASLGSTARTRMVRVPFFRPKKRPIGSGFSVAGYYGSSRGSIPVPYTFSERPEEPEFPYGKLPAKVFSAKNRIVPWDVLQREWRTPPLWGVADSGPYLHDGRAKTIDSAIRWHGGEARQSTTHYRSMPENQRHAIVAFLKSLRSPATLQVEKAERAARIAEAKPKPVEPTESVLVKKQDDSVDENLQEALELFRQAK